MPDAALRVGLRITPDHPFIHNGQWQLPRAVYTVEQITLDAVYNFELEVGGHSCWVNDVLVVTLGQRTIKPTDPAYSEWADAQWGWGWSESPERARYVAAMSAQHANEEAKSYVRGDGVPSDCNNVHDVRRTIDTA